MSSFLKRHYDYLFFCFFQFQKKLSKDKDMHHHSAIFQLSLLQTFNIMSIVLLIAGQSATFKINASYLLESRMYYAILLLPLIIVLCNYLYFRRNKRYLQVLSSFNSRSELSNTIFYVYFFGSFIFFVFSIFFLIE